MKLIALALLAACTTSSPKETPDAAAAPDCSVPAVTCFIYTDCAGRLSTIVTHPADGDLTQIGLDQRTAVEGSDHTCTASRTYGGTCVHTGDPAPTCVSVGCANGELTCEGVGGLCACFPTVTAAQVVCTR